MTHNEKHFSIITTCYISGSVMLHAHIYLMSNVKQNISQENLYSSCPGDGVSMLGTHMAVGLGINARGARAASSAGVAREGRMLEGAKPGKRRACKPAGLLWLLWLLSLPRRMRGTSHVSQASSR